MIKNVMVCKDFDGGCKIIASDKDTCNVNFEEVIDFIRFNQENRYVPIKPEHYVIGITYRYSGNRVYYREDEKHFISRVLNSGKQVSEEEANYWYSLFDGTMNRINNEKEIVHVLPNQKELLKALKGFIEENKQYENESQEPVRRPITRKRTIR